MFLLLFFFLVLWRYIQYRRTLINIYHEVRIEYGLIEEPENGENLDRDRAIRQRAVDILIGALFGLFLGIVSNIWVVVFDKLFLTSLSGISLVLYFIAGFVGMVVVAFIMWRHAL